MSLTDSQIQGKYKGVPFFTRKEVENNVGQARVDHRYPKTKVQYKEAMGENPFSCTITLFFAGEDFLQDYAKFKKAIRSPSPGRLYSPTFGVKESIVADPTSFTSDQTSIGEIAATVVFSETTSKPAPTTAKTSSQDVADKASEAREKSKDSFSDAYPAPFSANNITAILSDVQKFAEKVKDITGRVKETVNFIRKVSLYISDPEQLASLLLSGSDPLGFLQSTALAFTGVNGVKIFKQISTIGNDLSNAMNDIKTIIPKQSTFKTDTPQLTVLNTSINVWDSDTFERQQRNQARLAMTQVFRVTGLIGMMESASNASYSTTDEVDEVISDIETYYEALVDNDTTNVMIPEMKQILDELKGLTDIVLADQKQNAYGVTEINLYNPTSAYLLAYELYGEYLKTSAEHLYLADLIKGLNRSQPAHILQGAVKVVEIGN